jgi:hypothetical protein
VTTSRRSVQKVKNPLASPNATEMMRSMLTPLTCPPQDRNLSRRIHPIRLGCGR